MDPSTPLAATAVAGAVCLVRTPGGAVAELPPDRLDAISDLRESGALVWLDLADPGDAAIALIQEEFGVHPLAVEDMRKRGQRPKVDTYDEQYVVVAYEVRDDGEKTAARPPDEDSQDPEPGERRPAMLHEVHLVAGPGYLVSVHWGASAAIAATHRRFQARTAAVGTTVAMLLYGVLDAIVDGYFPLIDALNEEIEDIESNVVGGSAHATARDVLRAKRRLLELRRVVVPMREVANTLLRRDVELIEDAAVPYYQDLYDHVVRVLDALDLFRDLVAATLDASLTVTSNNLAAVMKRLTAYTVIIAVPTLIASIYGMNFDVMPETHWAFGYPAALLAMVVAVVLLFRYFRSRDWF